MHATGGMSGNVSDVNVTLNDLTYTNYDPSDLDIMLVAPDGTKVMLMSDLCGDGGDPAEYPITSPTDLTFDDSASGPRSRSTVTPRSSPTRPSSST